MKKYTAKIKTTRGFVLVELLVAVGLFAVIASIAVGGFVRALRTQRQAAALVSANNNVFLVLEQMAREFRTGRLFCANQADGSGTAFLCSDSGHIAFISGETNETIEYRLSDGAIERGVSGKFSKITGEKVLINYLRFTIVGNQQGDRRQPRITIAVGVSAKEAGASVATTNIETTVSSRASDS